jgi:hypothetical protein
MFNLIVGGIYYMAELKAGTKVIRLYLTASLVQYLFRPPVCHLSISITLEAQLVI